MSLKPDRLINHVMIPFTVDEYAERGELSFLDKDGVSTSTNHSSEHNHKYGYGFLLSDVVSLDMSYRVGYLYNLEEVCSGSKVELVTNGHITINTLSKSIKKKVVCGSKLYLTNNGRITLRKTNQFVGTCLSRADSSGFVKIAVSTF